MHIAIDAMGGDLGCPAAVKGAVLALQEHPELEIRLFGPRESLQAEVDALPRRLRGGLSARMMLVDAPQTISQSMKPSAALRAVEGNSMSAMLRCVANGEVDAGVSAGNTGALMALSRRALGTVGGIPRPAICTAIPTRTGERCYLLDLGANVDVSAERLVDFAMMGSVMAKRIDGLDTPRVALLNVGVEGTKGSRSVRAADTMLRSIRGIDYQGFIEGDGLYSGHVDVVVCDGFVGNVVLKASEGLARMLSERVQRTFDAHWGSRLVGMLARPALKRLKNGLDPVRYNGASLLGLGGIVVKSHGGADARGFAFAISRALQEVSQALPTHLEQELGGQRAVTMPVEDDRNEDDT
ncbi:phosphate acyltransferase PlsX [Aidingimonas lacisalsi]|uniref:phosphate acyltransferase PlsX n=1 Tax=Aidingimonas lacisalsi TaxID=2604086 RepID=UPI0011D24216|nr:phosphate acyltransferase PlsX [Aidingimonas lacisalsi]